MNKKIEKIIDVLNSDWFFWGCVLYLVVVGLDQPTAADGTPIMFGIFHKKKKQAKARPTVTDVSAVKNEAGEYVVSRSYAETVDLLSEGPIEGITSGNYSFVRNDNISGYKKAVFNHYKATGTAGETNELGFLQSIYWNEVPLVDSNGFYNFADINVDYSVGKPTGSVPKINPNLPQLGSIPTSDIMDLSINRSIGERLFGPEVKGGSDTPTNTVYAKPKGPIDKYAKTYRILNKECNKLIVNIKVTALQESLQFGAKTYKKGVPATGYGDQKARSIEYSIFYKPIFNDRFDSKDSENVTRSNLVSEGWRLGKKERVQGKIDSGYIRATTLDFSDKGFQDKVGFEGWEIRIVRTTPESLTSFLRNQSFVDSIVEVYGTKLTYPYSSMVYSIFDARSFQRIPSRAYDTHLLKVKVPNNYNPFIKSYGDSSASASNYYKGVALGNKTNTSTSLNQSDDGFTFQRKSENTNEEWDGNFAEELIWTDNPAWCFYDLVTNPRYGLGEYITEGQIDKWALYEIAKYCDELVDDTYGGFEPRFTINYIIRSREEAFKVLNDLSSIFRGISYYTNGSIFSSQDKLKNPVFHFNNSNVIDSNFTYSSSSKKARHSVAIVRYNDKRNTYKPAVEYLEDEEAVRRYGIREIETTALGCTSRGQARRFAKWILASEYQETETVSFGAGLEGAYLRPGDVITIYDNFRNKLKHSGRTNSVIKGRTVVAGAPTDDTALNATQRQNVNSIILDQAITLDPDTKYKFSLLAPTYDYYSGTIETSNELPGVRRTQVQNLAFNGSDVINITGGPGAFRSNLRDENSAVCTRIFFNSGMAVENTFNYNGEAMAKGNVGTYTGNQLNFGDYVITGYSNNSVENESQAVPYSGNYYSGQNLIWSIEPLFEDDPKFINNSFSSYRIINIKEEENKSYNIQGLSYSTGKYTEVDEVGTSFSKTANLQMYFPIPNNAGGTSNLNTWTSNYPQQNPKPSASENERNNNILLVQEDKPSINGVIKENYVTLKSEFSVAGFKNNLNIANDDGTVGINYGESRDINKISYSFSIVSTGDPQITNDWAAANDPRIVPVVNTQTQSSKEKSVTYLVSPDYYDSMKENEFALVTSENTQFFNNEKTKIEIESLVGSIPRDNNNNIMPFYIVVYPISEQGIVGYGLLRGITLSEEAQQKLISPVEAYSISSLTTRDENDIPIQTSSAGDTLLYSLDNTEPVFEWTLGSQDPVFNRPEDEESSFGRYELDFTQVQDVQYRLTIREPSSSNIPSNNIYFEFTGYSSDSTIPSFTFNENYNTPAIIDDIAGAGQTYNGDQLNNRQIGKHQIVGQDGKVVKEYFKCDASGFVIQNSPMYPLREFDVVVEVQDSFGRTSSNNTVYSNTIIQGTDPNKNQESYDEKLFNNGYDILGVQIASPSGLFFAQEDSPKGFSPRYLSMEQAATLNYPYKASVRLMPEGKLAFTFEEVQNDKGKVLLSDEEIDKFFNDAQGAVIYYTTGNSSVAIEEDSEGNVLQNNTKFTNLAPHFEIDIAEQANNSYLLLSDKNVENGRASEVTNKTLSNGEVVGSAFDGVVTTEKDGNFIVYRDAFIFGDNDGIDGFEMPFPMILRPEVTNIQLSMAFFDSLSLNKAFNVNDNEAPRMETAVINNETFQIERIFRDTSLNFSTLPKKDVPFTITNVTSTQDTAFLNELGSSFRMGEFNANSAYNTSLGYQAWGEITVGRRDRESKILCFDHAAYGIGTAPEITFEEAVSSTNAFNIIDSNTDTLEASARYYSMQMDAAFGKGNVDFQGISMYAVSKRASYNEGSSAWLRGLGPSVSQGYQTAFSLSQRRIIILNVPLEDELSTISPNKYSVTISTESPVPVDGGINTNLPIPEDTNEMDYLRRVGYAKGNRKGWYSSKPSTAATTDYQVIKEAGQFTVIIRQDANDYFNHDAGRWMKADFGISARLKNGGGLKIKFGVLADME